MTPLLMISLLKALVPAILHDEHMFFSEELGAYIVLQKKEKNQGDS